MRCIHANSTQQRRSNSILKMTAVFVLSYFFHVQDIKEKTRVLSGTVVSLLYCKENQVKNNKTVFERVQQYTKIQIP